MYFILIIGLQAGTLKCQAFCCSSISCQHLPKVGRGQGRCQHVRQWNNLIKFIKVSQTVLKIFFSSPHKTISGNLPLIFALCCVVVDWKCSSISITSAKAASLISSIRGLQEAASTLSLLSSTRLHYHVRLQRERLINILRLIMSLVPLHLLHFTTN